MTVQNKQDPTPYNQVQTFQQPEILEYEQKIGIQGSMKQEGLRWKILALYLSDQNSFPLNGKDYSIDSINEVLQGCDDIQVRIEREISKQQFVEVLHEYRPNLLYVCGNFTFEQSTTLFSAQISDLILQDENSLEPLQQLTSDEFAAIIDGLELSCVYLDVHQEQDVYGHKLIEKGVECVISVPYGIPLPALPTLQLSHAFFGFLRHPNCSIYEAVTLASHTQQIHPNTLQLLPQFWGENSLLNLPNTSSIPFPEATETQGALDSEISLVDQVDGWADMRMLAPRAEARLQICGFQNIIDPQRLGFVSQSLRSLLVFETRNLVVLDSKPLNYKIPQLITGEGYQFTIQTTSGATCSVVLGGPVEIFQDSKLVEHALRITLTSDAMTLQFRIPPPGIPTPRPVILPNVAYGTPVIECTACTSVWAVQVMKSLSQSPYYRGFVPLGIAAIANNTVASFQPSDAIRFCNVITQLNPDADQILDPKYLDIIQQQLQEEELQQIEPEYNNEPVVVQQEPQLKQPATAEKANGAQSAPPKQKGIPQSTTHNPPSSQLEFRDPDQFRNFDYGSTRPPLDQCSEEQFLDDVARFLEKKRGQKIDRSKFPDSILNKTPLDLFSLYLAVCERGGYRMGNSINWKSWIFPKMRNWTSDHKMTGIGNDLKKRYVRYLEEYEYANPQDVTNQ